MNKISVLVRRARSWAAGDTISQLPVRGNEPTCRVTRGVHSVDCLTRTVAVEPRQLRQHLGHNITPAPMTDLAAERITMAIRVGRRAVLIRTGRRRFHIVSRTVRVQPPYHVMTVLDEAAGLWPADADFAAGMARLLAAARNPDIGIPYETPDPQIADPQFLPAVHADARRRPLRGKTVLPFFADRPDEPTP